MTIDEELTLLDESVRRLKIEYDVYFGGGSKRPPSDTEWRVQSLIKKHGDNGKLNYAQRFRYNSIVQKHAIFSDLWRQKMKIKEEGYRRPQDAILGIQGLRSMPESAKTEPADAQLQESGPFRVTWSGAEQETGKLETLYQVLVQAKNNTGEQLAHAASFDTFKNFVQRKTDQLRQEYGCNAVEYSVELQDGRVKLKARAKI